MKLYLKKLNNMSVYAVPQQNPFKSFIVSAGRFLFETPTEVTICAVAGIALQILFPPFATACFGAFVSVMFTRLTVRVLNHIEWKPLKQIVRQTLDFQNKYPKLKIITFIFALNLGLIHWIASMIASISLGIFYGITTRVLYLKKLQKLNRKDIN